MKAPIHEEPPQAGFGRPASDCSVTVYRLVLSSADWPRETRTKWQESPDFTKALAKAKELNIETRIESQTVSDGAITSDNGWASFASQNADVLAPAGEKTLTKPQDD